MLQNSQNDSKEFVGMSLKDKIQAQIQQGTFNYETQILKKVFKNPEGSKVERIELSVCKKHIRQF